MQPVARGKLPREYEGNGNIKEIFGAFRGVRIRIFEVSRPEESK
jgi:hypothetical protein